MSNAVLRGAQSRPSVEKHGDEMAARGPRRSVMEFAGIGHAPMLLVPDQSIRSSRSCGRRRRLVGTGPMKLALNLPSQEGSESQAGTASGQGRTWLQKHEAKARYDDPARLIGDALGVDQPSLVEHARASN